MIFRFLLAVVSSATLRLEVMPAHPQLGDTVSIVVHAEAPPTVTVDGKAYTAFALGPERFRALVPTTPLEHAGPRQVHVTAGVMVQDLTLDVRDRQFPVQRIRMPPGKRELKATPLERERVAAFKDSESPEKAWAGPFAPPLPTEISTVFGVRRYYDGRLKEDYYHRGVDFRGAYGTPVKAAAGGWVRLVGRAREGFRVHGNVVGIDHGQGVTTLYLHLSRIRVRPGDRVQPGETIGNVGSTGAATGPHLHWGLYVHGQAVDPGPWLTTGIE